jgi:predicted nuclease of predicted toxin-antitoxin system
MCILADWEFADNEAIWEYAGREGFTIVSKDSDFQERSVLWDNPPKVIWPRIPNSSTSEIASWIRGALVT